MSIVRFVVSPLTEHDPRSRGYLDDAHALGFERLTRIDCYDLFFIDGHLDAEEASALAGNLLSDPVTQTVAWESADGWEPVGLPADCFQVEVAPRPGVTDPVAEEIVRAAGVLQIKGVERASTGRRFLIKGNGLVREDIELLTKRLLANPVTQRYSLGQIEAAFPTTAEASARVDLLEIRGLTSDQLLRLSQDRRAALDLEEMLAVQRYCETEGRDLSDVEFEAVAQTWSEHCVHKTFKAMIEIENYADLDPLLQTKYPGGQVNNLMRTFLKAATDQIAAPWVRSAFVDNAGILDFDGENEISFKVETHNHPSAIEPFGGANTGVGGVIRDVLGVSAKPIAATDVLCFGPQDLPFERLPVGVLHPRRIQSGVVAGVQDYGNKIGIPTVSGAVLYDEGFTSNPLVFCGCVGIAPVNSNPHAIGTGDRVIVLGGRTGRDGLRGATFSSMTMDAQTGEVAGASVQIGAPITEKGLIEVILRARDERLYNAITDCGAGGLSSAVGEMASTIGGDIELQDVRLKYPGLAPWEIWLSEAQERMVLAVPASKLERLKEICALYDVDLTDIGAFLPSGRLVVRYGAQVVLDLSNEFLHEGIPQRKLKARISPLTFREPRSVLSGQRTAECDFGLALLKLLRHPNIASKAAIIRIYDHEVQGGTVIKPLTGVREDGPSDACVLHPMGGVGRKALVLGAGVNAEYGKLDPYRMAASVIDEAVRNAVAVGADPQRIAILDNFCWGDPMRPEVMGSLLEASRACYETALLYGTPFISGKDSLNNEYMGTDGHRHAIPPTLLISSLGVIDDYSLAVSMDLKGNTSLLYLVGAFNPRLGASHYRLAVEDLPFDGEVPPLEARSREVYRALNRAIRGRTVRACHDLSEGGLAVAAAEMCIGGRLGAHLEIPSEDPILELYGETNGCLLVEVSRAFKDVFLEYFDELPVRQVGLVRSDGRFTVQAGDGELINQSVDELADAWMHSNGEVNL